MKRSKRQRIMAGFIAGLLAIAMVVTGILGAISM